MPRPALSPEPRRCVDDLLKPRRFEHVADEAMLGDAPPQGLVTDTLDRLGAVFSTGDITPSIRRIQLVAVVAMDGDTPPICAPRQR